jgi:hypothetical protein
MKKKLGRFKFNLRYNYHTDCWSAVLIFYKWITNNYSKDIKLGHAYAISEKKDICVEADTEIVFLNIFNFLGMV